jgi:hypothetical protein
MMKNLVLAIFLITIASFGACKKCTTCSSYDSAGNVILNEVKTCGNSAEIEKAKDKAKNSGALLGGTYSCVDE